MKKKNLLCAVFVLAMFAGCKGGELPTSPRCDTPECNPPQTCTIKFSPSSVTVPAEGGTLPLGLTKCSCTSAQPSMDWATVNWTDQTFTVPKNTKNESRFGKITACGAELLVTQLQNNATTCTYTTTTTHDDRPNCEAGEGSFAVIVTGTSCPFAPVSDSPSWLTIVPGCPTCTNVTYRYTRNDTGVTRVGHITVGTCTYTVTQPPCPPTPTCNFDVSPTSLDFSCPGGDKTVTVTTGATCGWHADSIPGFSVSQSGEWRQGSGTVKVTATRNGNSSQNGTIYVAGKPVSVSQQACVDNPPFSCTRPGRVEIPVTEQFTCPDGSVKSATITVVGTGSFTSDTSCSHAQTQADAAAQADANSKVAAARIQARANAQAQCPTVQPCTFSVQNTPLNWSWDSTSNSGVAVSTQAGCDWSVSASQTWVAFPEGTSGSGPGDFKVAPGSNNTVTTTRNATVTFIGEGGYTQTIPVSQTGKPATTCTFAVQNTSVFYTWNPAANTGVVVSTQTGCTWSVSPTATWIGVSPTSGTGGGEFFISAAGNSGGERNAKVLFTGQGGFATEILVTQSAKP
ncbi:MAG: BACON domain-containing carbohydrate-binding protein [Minisyncoccia bacterium]